MGMNPTDRRLLRHVMTAVVIKLMALSVLWWVFVQDHQVKVDADTVSAQWTQAESAIHKKGASK
jgi:hypothetical protein